MKLILLGAPGAGKGTQADIIKQKLGIPTISTGNILRAAVKNGTPTGLKAKEYMDAGALVPNDLIIGLMKEKIGGLDKIILDGFPRTVEQADALAEQVDIDIAINIDVPDEELITRLTQRRSCPDCNAVYHLANKPPAKEGICDKCGEQLGIRHDDEPEVVLQRLDVYHAQTEPVKHFYDEIGKLRSVEGIGTVEEIRDRIFAALELNV